MMELKFYRRLKPKFSRRSFIKYSFRLSVLAFLGFGFERRNNIKTELIRLNFSNLPPSFNGFRIVQISDLHASYWVGKKYLMDMVETVNKLKKDLLVITGDMITGSVNDFWKRWMPAAKHDYLSMMINVLGNLKDGDKIAVLGNHDQWDGIETEKRLVKEPYGYTYVNRGVGTLVFPLRFRAPPEITYFTLN